MVAVMAATCSYGTHQPKLVPTPRSQRCQVHRHLSRTSRRQQATVMHSTATEEAVLNKADCPSVKAAIALDVVESLDVRVGVVVGANALTVQEEVRRGDQVRTRNKQILQLQVDIGTEVRSIVGDIYQILDEESAIGKKLLVVANVPPRDVHGHPSHGYLLMGVNYDSTPMPRSLKNVFPGAGRLPPGSTYEFV